ncbi:hypothetical protein Tco_0916404 [Tanacetum coccineum]
MILTSWVVHVSGGINRDICIVKIMAHISQGELLFICYPTNFPIKLFRAWQLNIHKKNSLISSKPDRAHICTIITPLYWKQHLREISIEQLCDIHDRAYMRKAILDNVLNSRTWELISALHKAKLLLMLFKHGILTRIGPILNRKESVMRLFRIWIRILLSLICVLRSMLCRDKWMVFIEIDSLKQDRAAVVSKFILNAAMKLINNDDLGSLIARLVRSSIIYGRCQAFKEVAVMEEPFVLEKMSGYQPSLKEEYDRAGDALANASYPFLAEYVGNPYASLEQLLSKKYPMLRSTFSGSRSKPLSSKVK